LLARIARLRPWLALAGLILAAVVLLPPVGTAARHYVFAQAVQFALLAVAVPALVVVGAPWRQLAALAGTKGASVADRLMIARSHRPSRARPWVVLVTFIAVALAWRIPAAVNALVSFPALTVAEAITLVGTGCALWLELAESPPLLPRIARPQRAAFAALPMWALWASAYIMGFSRTNWFRSLAHPAGSLLSTVADQEIAVVVLWAIPGLCFVPVVYVCLVRWLRDSAEPDDELREVTSRASSPRSGPGLPRPPRGWRLPSCRGGGPAG
jgi:cytochrome c oxidase assembly factor CtaG